MIIVYLPLPRDDLLTSRALLVVPPCVQVFWESKYPSYECAGNFGVPAVTSDPAKLKELQTMELKNGRLAMIGIISFASAVAIPGSVPFYPF